MTESPSNKRLKSGPAADVVDYTELCDAAFGGYRDHIASCGPDNPEGDTDELLAIMELLQNESVANVAFQCHDDDNEPPASLVDLLPVLHSVAATTLADDLIGQFLMSKAESADERAEIEAQIRRLLKLALKCLPNNASTWSMAANLARMTQTLELDEISRLYTHAADCASDVRACAIHWVADDSVIQEYEVKEWIETLLLNQVVCVMLEEDDDGDAEKETGDEDDDEENDEETDKETDENDTKQDAAAPPNDNDVEDRWSSSDVESTARFMAATLLSLLDDHETAKEQLQKFDLTHRIHPNVWKGAIKKTNTKLSPVDPDNLEPALYPKEVLPENLYERLCQVFAPDAVYWAESAYEQRGYYSYFSDLPTPCTPPSNLVEDVICSQLLPLVQKRLSPELADSIVGYEWWVHTRPLQANLGHNLHFDTDEAMLSQSQEISHPIFSSVLYLTGGSQSGPTFVLDQAPHDDVLPETCWYQTASNNSLLVFPGNLLHGVLPCPVNLDDDCELGFQSWLDTPILTDRTNEEHRLTFMVGFWTRSVPETMENRRLYGPCGPLPPPSPEHSWVTMLREGYEDLKSTVAAARSAIQPMAVTQISPVWEVLDCQPPLNDAPLVLPRAIDHRFFVKDAPRCFYDSLFERDEFDDADDDDGHHHEHDHDHGHSHDHDGEDGHEHGPNQDDDGHHDNDQGHCQASNDEACGGCCGRS